MWAKCKRQLGVGGYSVKCPFLRLQPPTNMHILCKNIYYDRLSDQVFTQLIAVNNTQADCHKWKRSIHRKALFFSGVLRRTDAPWLLITRWQTGSRNIQAQRCTWCSRAVKVYPCQDGGERIITRSINTRWTFRNLLKHIIRHPHTEINAPKYSERTKSIRASAEFTTFGKS